jgi:hypothetical protein
MNNIQVGDLYHPLLKLLDDSSDTIILAICTTLKPFFKVAPPGEYSITLIDYTLETLFIHLDDSNDKIQKCVFEILETMAPLCAPKLFKRAQQGNVAYICLLDPPPFSVPLLNIHSLSCLPQSEGSNDPRTIAISS